MGHRRLRAALVAAPLIGALALAGQASAQPTTPTPPTTGPTTTAPATTGPDTTGPNTSTTEAATTPPTLLPPPPAGEPGAVPVTGYLAPEPDLANPTLTDIDEVIQTADPDVVLVTFWSGVVTCNGVQRVEVTESAERVLVGVYTGERQPGQPCILMAQRYATEVALDAPLGDRAVVSATELPDVPGEPSAYAGAAFDAWAAGDTAELSILAAAPVVDLLETRPWTAQDDWSAEPQCESAEGTTTCAWTAGGTTLTLSIDDAAVASGLPRAVVGASLTATADGVPIPPAPTVPPVDEPTPPVDDPIPPVDDPIPSPDEPTPEVDEPIPSLDAATSS